MTNRRPVDNAMAANRPEKNFVRQLWVDEIQKVEEAGYNNKYPLYLTLPGAMGIEIRFLIEKGIIRITETGAIHEEDLHKIVAVESSRIAQVKLLRQFPGLNVLKMSIQSLVRGDGQRNFPDNRDEIIYCKAKIINLDLDEPIMVDDSKNELFIPVIEWIKKFFLLHKEGGIDWSLCLTLHGEMFWNANVNTQVIRFLVDNCSNDDQFREMLVAHLGEHITQAIFDAQIDFTNIERSEAQRVAMILIPKLLVHHAVNNGWVIKTVHNYAYVGGGGAPMVTWIFNFYLDPEATAQPITEYKNGIRNIFHQVGSIDGDGNLVPYR